MRPIEVIGVASHLGARNAHCELGPQILYQSSFIEDLGQQYGVNLHWHSTIRPQLTQPKNNQALQQSLAKLCQQLSRQTETLVKNSSPFIVIGGDHSCAMGTWSGVINGIPDPTTFGLVWIDAHLDAHTFETSPSGNIHGMPVAALLGKGGKALQSLCPAKNQLNADNLLMLGIRSYESEERDLLEKLDVTIFSNHQVNQAKDFPTMFRHLIDDASNRWDYFGISIDLDAIDPKDAPAVGTPEPDGISSADLCSALKAINNCEKLIGIEIAEYEPTHDRHNKTKRLISDIVGSLYGDPNYLKSP